MGQNTRAASGDVGAFDCVTGRVPERALTAAAIGTMTLRLIILMFPECPNGEGLPKIERDCNRIAIATDHDPVKPL